MKITSNPPPQCYGGQAFQRPTSNVQWGNQRALRLLLVLLLVLDGGRLARAELPGLDYAARPIADGVPQVAVVRLRGLLAGKMPAEERRAATTKLGEALVATGQPEAALKVLAEPSVRDIPETAFFRAQALARLARWAEALPLYENAASESGFRFRAEALFGTAQALRALGRPEEALQVLHDLAQHQSWRVRARYRSVELLLDKNDVARAARTLDSVQPRDISERKERRYLRGCVEAKLHRRERAIRAFASILGSPEGAPHPLLVATLFSIAETHLRASKPEEGDDYLEEFIERHPADPELARIFAKLDQLYAAQRRQTRHELGRWSRDAAQPRRALAQWHLARAELRLGRREQAVAIFRRLHKSRPAVPALAEAFLEHARLELEDGRLEQAVAILESARKLRPAPALLQQIDSLAGRGYYTAERFDAAAKSFQRVALAGSAYTKDALFNASLAWLQSGDAAQLAASKQELAQRGGDEQLRGDLLLEQGLVDAAKGGKNAAAALQNFLREFPKHPRASEAWVALAEMAFHAAPPRLDEARKNLALAVEAQWTPAAKERADYLGIWIEDTMPTPDEAKVIALASRFLQEHSASPLAADVRLKLAETFYRRQNFAAAQTQFELLAPQKPDSALAEKARFFAARSAMQTMGPASLDRALVLFGEVVKGNGEWKWAARNEQALIERRLGKPQDAMTLYDEVLRSDAKPEEKREALCAKADILYELGATERENYRRAIALYEQLAEQAEGSAHWRNQALFKKGTCLEKLALRPEALATFYQIVEGEGRPDRPREYFWFYKAGFNAARLLEEESKWQPAAAIYEKLAFAGGGRSEEARARLNRVRLEHYLWEQ